MIDVVELVLDLRRLAGMHRHLEWLPAGDGHAAGDERGAKSMCERGCEHAQRGWRVEASVERLEANLLRVVGGARRRAACFAH